MHNLLGTIESKLEQGEDISFKEGCELFECSDLLSIAAVANRYREKLHGKVTYYNWNLHLNSTNVCEADCLFCSFARLKTGDPEAYTMSVEEAHRWISQRYRPGMTEIHIVNGLNPELDFDYYESLLRMIRRDFPALHIKAFTAVEIHYFAEKFAMSYTQVLEKLIDAGLGSLPGGGAEVFSERVRKKICRDKANSQQWLEVHRAAHNLGLKSNCTMLYGTVERPAELVEHLLQLRDLQSETGGFQAFIPLAFHNEGNRMAKLPSPTGMDDLRIVALSRILLHNIPHIKAYWVMLGIKTAQIAQSFGANDIDGTVTEEKIYHMAGSRSPDALSIPELRRVIEAAGRIPVERDTLYRPIDLNTEGSYQQSDNRYGGSAGLAILAS
ncbi:MAG: aminofutalosine synthase MqnE [Deltaproteobacteria bacterium]|nr:aminofutalosine synthase MqnE [Deltaproteobacteria bacterium]